MRRWPSGRVLYLHKLYFIIAKMITQLLVSLTTKKVTLLHRKALQFITEIKLTVQRRKG